MDIEVFEGAMRIAREEYPALDPEAYRLRLDALAGEGRVEGRGRAAVAALNDLVFGRLGFRGNREDYYDPRNSYLNDVIDRRLGIPITLSAVYAEIGRRVGLEVEGIGFPGHFLARVTLERGHAVVDCFAGRTL
ncbi:MAG TPA: transglutaminase-like domain-containing protein, partial [Planctomycetota bacterium]|nr:transglutaminase-like domain-containing protein [Planctomycetota bacterium]